MPFADQFQRCMKLPRKGDVIENFLVENSSITHRNMLDGVYFFPVELIVIGERKNGKQNIKEVFKPIFEKVSSLFTEYGSLYQGRYEKLEIQLLAPKTYKLTTTGIACRIYPKQELESFIQFLKQYTGSYELNADVIIRMYLNYYQKILQC